MKLFLSKINSCPYSTITTLQIDLLDQICKRKGVSLLMESEKTITSIESERKTRIIDQRKVWISSIERKMFRIQKNKKKLPYKRERVAIVIERVRQSINRLESGVNFSEKVGFNFNSEKIIDKKMVTLQSIFEKANSFRRDDVIQHLFGFDMIFGNLKPSQATRKTEKLIDKFNKLLKKDGKQIISGEVEQDGQRVLGYRVKDLD